MEHTVEYREYLASSLAATDFFVSAVSPKLIKDFGNNTLRKVKSDKGDSIKISRSGLDNWADLSPYTVVDQLRIQLKSITRQHDFYSKKNYLKK